MPPIRSTVPPFGPASATTKKKRTEKAAAGGVDGSNVVWKTPFRGATRCCRKLPGKIGSNHIPVHFVMAKGLPKKRVEMPHMVG